MCVLLYSCVQRTTAPQIPQMVLQKLGAWWTWGSCRGWTALAGDPGVSAVSGWHLGTMPGVNFPGKLFILLWLSQILLKIRAHWRENCTGAFQPGGEGWWEAAQGHWVTLRCTEAEESQDWAHISIFFKSWPSDNIFLLLNFRAPWSRFSSSLSLIHSL